MLCCFQQLVWPCSQFLKSPQLPPSSVSILFTPSLYKWTKGCGKKKRERPNQKLKIKTRSNPHVANPKFKNVNNKMIKTRNRGLILRQEIKLSWNNNWSERLACGTLFVVGYFYSSIQINFISSYHRFPLKKIHFKSISCSAQNGKDLAILPAVCTQQ